MNLVSFLCESVYRSVNPGVFSIADVPALIGQGITKYRVRTSDGMYSIT